MVVDPDVLVRSTISDYLRECGYKVLEGVAVADVWTVLHSGRNIDVILAEVKLPGDSDGFELARQIRERFPQIDILLTSSAGKLAGKAGDLCDEGPLEKPYESAEVLRRIQLLRERRRQSEKPGHDKGGGLD